MTTTSQEEKQGEARELGREIASQNFTNLLLPKLRFSVAYYVEMRALGSGEDGGNSLR